MKMYVGVTDRGWFEHLSSRQVCDEINFWQPSPRNLPSLQIGDRFLFKLKSPVNAIVGGGRYLKSLRMPISYAWRAYGEKNGVSSLEELRQRLLKLRQGAGIERSDFEIGCILLGDAFYLRQGEWIPQPETWAANIVRGRSYDLSSAEGQYLSKLVDSRFVDRTLDEFLVRERPREDSDRFALTRLRPGQSYFRAAVASAYGWRCALTGERVVPVLEAAHIRPFSDGGPNLTENGLFLRADLHKLLDEGYATVTTDYRFKVSTKVREDYSNGREYYDLQGSEIRKPASKLDWPNRGFIEWHNKSRFRG